LTDDQKLQAQANVGAAMAAFGASLMLLGCLGPVIAFAVFLIWVIYGPTLAILVVAIPVVLVLLLVSLTLGGAK
jgi:hypothetical protein